MRVAERRAPGGVLGRLVGFTVLPLLALVMPFLLMPTISAMVGTPGWSSVYAGQSVGVIASVLILWGWNVDGTVAVAQTTDAAERAGLYARSMRTRLLLAAVLTPLAALVAGLLFAKPGFAGETAAMTVAYAVLGLSPAWYCVGAGRPVLLALYDALPRFVATVGAAVLLPVTGQLWVFPALMIVASAVALVVFQRRYAPGRPWWPTGRGTLAELGEQRHTAGINLAGQVYAMTPAPIANATLPAAPAGALSTTDQLYRLGLFSAVALGNALQGWTLEPGIADRRRRHLVALAAHAALGVAGIGVLLVAGPPVGAFLSSGQGTPTAGLLLMYGLAFAFLSTATPLIRNLLIPAGHQPLVLRVTLIAAALGLAVMVLAGLAGVAEGVAGGMAASELAMLLLLAPPAWRELNREEPDDRP